MNIGTAVGIFMNIESDDYTELEKCNAILAVLEMPTHNGISKKTMLRVMWWLWSKAFNVTNLASGG